ncbi:hypothetical protein GLOIN_2v1827941 [Rhizophagus irregularis DAOM 181602=DAOM 197198]|nr:hypothetical protein GLOIN_2v1827941 [Rhizophagus irregularis DAOM 181602=DAOM 197198]
MDSLRRELALSRKNVELKNVDLDLKKNELSKKKGELMRLRDELTSTRIELMNEKKELMQMRDNLFSIPKTFSESEVLGEIIVIDSQSNTQKNQKTGLLPMKLYLIDMDETIKHESSRIRYHRTSPS